MTFTRKKFPRYSTVEVGMPPVDPQPLKNYPSFTPEMGSFNRDKFQRAGNTYSDKHFQLFVSQSGEFESSNLDTYRKQILEGVDFFKARTSKPAKWSNREIDNTAYTKRIKNTFRAYKDSHRARPTAPQDWESALNIYGPVRLFSLMEELFRSIYLLITREQAHYALFTYYYFYYYFYLNEYILENIFLYFPVARVFFSNQIFSTFEGVYFSFFEISLGFFLPFFVLFTFSQYAILRAYVLHKVYFLSGFGLFFSTLVLPYVYYFTGFSTLFFFLFIFLFFTVYSVFYIFEYSGFIYYDNHNFSSYSSFFLPIYKPKEILYLPLYVYKYPFKGYFFNQKFLKKNFTRYPFTQNVENLLRHHRRIKNFRIGEILIFKNKNLSLESPSMGMSGLVFPGSSSNSAYSIQTHRNFIQSYPRENFSPFNETTDHDFHAETERDFFPLFTRDYINHPDGYSQISFVEFVSKFKATRSFDSRLNPASYDEEFDFYNAAPSKKALEFLYPYFSLKIWLSTVKPISGQADQDSFFCFQNILFEKSPKSEYPSFVPFFFFFIIKNFFSLFSNFLDKITLFKYKKFPTSRSTLELLNTLTALNKILTDTNRLSPQFYLNVYIFIRRSLYKLNTTFLSFPKLSVSQIFTYTLILIKIEEAITNVSDRIELLESFDKSYKYGNFFVKNIKKRIS
jgi:hypothetical protein